MKAKRSVALALGIGMLLGALAASTLADEKSGPRIETVLKSDLASADDLEVIVSIVDIPAATTLPKHHHPGEEFIYVLEGSGYLWLDGQGDTMASAGDAAKIPLEQIHTARTDDEPMRAVVFRVHKKGEPERILVE